MRPIIICTLLLIASIPILSNAQSNELGLLPRFNINKKLEKDWSVNLQIESRNEVIDDGLAYDYVLTDASLLVAKKVTLHSTLAGGYLMRREDGQMIHRAIQQVAVIQNIPSVTLAHRFSTDQTFESEERNQVRLRYRLSTQVPLNGQTLDPKEFFLKLSGEVLNEWQGSEYGLEMRAVAFLGYAFQAGSKLELGLDYRLDGVIANEARNRMWIGVNYYLSI